MESQVPGIFDAFLSHFKKVQVSPRNSNLFGAKLPRAFFCRRKYLILKCVPRPCDQHLQLNHPFKMIWWKLRSGVVCFSKRFHWWGKGIHLPGLRWLIWSQDFGVWKWNSWRDPSPSSNGLPFLGSGISFFFTTFYPCQHLLNKMQNSFVNRGQKGPKTIWRNAEEKRGIPKSTIKVAVLNALQVLRNAPKDAKWQGNINFNPTSLHKVSNSKLKQKGKTIAFFWCNSSFWRFLFSSPGEDQTTPLVFFHPSSQGKIPLEDLVLVGILHRLFGFFWQFRELEKALACVWRWLILR